MRRDNDSRRRRISQVSVLHRNSGALSACPGECVVIHFGEWRRSTTQIAGVVYEELFRTRAFTVAAAMAFYFLLSLVPLLAIISALLGYLPIPHLFDQLLDLLATFVPPDSMHMVETILASILTPHHGGLLSIGILGYLWSATGGFAACIEALNIAYDVIKERSWWRDRVQALLLTLTTGGLSMVALFCVIAGPHFGHFLAELFPVPEAFADMWPFLRLVAMFLASVVAIELLYYFGPNRKQRFVSTLPGAIVAVLGFFGASAIMSYYFDHFSNYNKTYGSLGAVIMLMLWFYVLALFILIGAEINAEIAKRRQFRRFQHDKRNPFDRPMPGVPAA
ncbi:MAG: YihY/virulence factor BrkB family protein [Acidobacteriaceae bacterium]